MDKRGLGIPTVVDRLIQQAIVQVLSPMYEQQFSETSYGFRPNRSCEMAIIKLLEYFNDGYTWVVDIDLQKFFDTVCHDKLISIIMKTIHDGELVSLIRKYLVNLKPLFSSSLSNSFNMILDNSGDKLPPCGVPTFVRLTTPFSITPLTKYFLINDTNSPS